MFGYKRHPKGWETSSGSRNIWRSLERTDTGSSNLTQGCEDILRIWCEQSSQGEFSLLLIFHWLNTHNQGFAHEAVIWRQLFHPNVLPFYGVYHLDDLRSRLCLISPWMEHGNVMQFLKQAPETDLATLVSNIVIFSGQSFYIDGSGSWYC